MYLFRLAPISVDFHDWTTQDDLVFNALADPDSYVIPEWNPIHEYMTGDYASAVQYAYISLKNNNTDDPAKNYVGRPPKPWLDSTFGYGNNTWLRIRMLSKYSCFDLVRPDYTWSYQGNLTFTMYPKKMVPADESSRFFGSSANPLKLYLILTGIVGDSVTITTSAGSTVIPLSKYGSASENDLCFDWGTNLELPGVIGDTIVYEISNIHEGTGSVQVAITRPTTHANNAHAAITGCYFGRGTRLGITHQDTLSFGFNDFSKVTEDSWGHVSITKGKVSRNIEASVTVDTKMLDAVFKLIQAVRATPTFFLFSNNLDGIKNRAIPGITSIMGLAQTASIEAQNAKSSTFSINITSIPNQFVNVFDMEDVNLCGLPYLPVVPVVDTTPIPEPTPPASTVAATGVIVTPETQEGTVGRSYLLKATVQPTNAGNKKVIWSSSNNTVATVSALGIVTINTIGTATITATTVDGGFTDTCAVTGIKVVLPYEPPDGGNIIFRWDGAVYTPPDGGNIIFRWD